MKVYKTAAGDYTALKGIDLRVKPGEFAAVLGKSGAGKSTMVNLITGIDRPTSGEIIVNGTAIHHLHEDQRSRWRGRNLGVVFQFFQLLPSLTLIENITLAMDFCNTYPLRERKDARCNCSIKWASPSTPTKFHRVFPAGSSSAWRLRAR